MQLEYSAGKMRAQLDEEALLCRNVTILSYKRALGTLLPVKLVGLSEPFYVDSFVKFIFIWISNHHGLIFFSISPLSYIIILNRLSLLIPASP